MAFQKGHKDKLVARYTNNEASEKELQAFFGLLSKNELDVILESDMDQEILAIRESMTVKRKTILWSRIAGIAAAVAFIALGAWFFMAKQQVSDNKTADIISTNDIVPGKNRATLTLGNGKVITLSEEKSGVVIDVSSGLIYYNDGTKVKASSEGAFSGAKKMLTMSTPKGGAYQVILPDGTKTWLNAASTLKFLEDFSGANQRRVELIGEAYFEVAKDKQHPFIVVSRGQEVEVLGTHFNINSYESEADMRTTLLEGSVKVSYKSNDYLLTPGMQAKIGDRVRLSNVDADQVVAWMRGDFNFKDENIQSIMRKISRWYDMDVVYVGNVENKDFDGTVSRFKNVSEVLKMLELTDAIHFKVEEGRIIVMP